MYSFGNANDIQKEAILNTEGPLLIIAGPGTGKTFTLVKRAAYLIVEKGIPPEQIMIATFTEKAAKELVTRITNELMDLGVSANLNEMYIGTFHSICLRIIKENLEYSRVKKNFRLLDSFEQQYIIFQNIYKFRNIENFDCILGNRSGAWYQSEYIANMINNISEELVDCKYLYDDDDDRISVMGKVMKLYYDILMEQNLLDFSTIQTEVYRMLLRHGEVLNKLQEKIQYIMVDEYQDTNYVQERLIFLFSGSRNNICVVGDDDQGLYRFRGATIRNILEFPEKFTSVKCKRLNLITNYRSEKDIVSFYNEWMSTTNGRDFKFDWGKYRFNKKIVACKDSKPDTATVIKVSGEEYYKDWYENIYLFIEKLKSSNVLTDLNQVAILFNSVKNKHVIELSEYLETKGINVYSPRSNLFFERPEIKAALGCLMLTFPFYVEKLGRGEYTFVNDELRNYYTHCILYAHDYIKRTGFENLKKWTTQHGVIHSNLTRNTDYAFAGLLYQVFEYNPFKEYLSIDLNGGLIDSRPARNLAILTQVISKYEYLHRVDVFTSKNINDVVERFFNMYLKFLYDGGIGEYEDDSEYAPSGCVSFLTIHQSKGMEFPIVIVGSLWDKPKTKNNPVLEEIERKYFKRPKFELKEDIKYFDFWRLYYTAFSRAQNLLVLSGRVKNGRGKTPTKYFEDLYEYLPDYDSNGFNADNLELAEVKDVNIKDTYSFTSHITLYENCSLQYKFYKELGFTPVRVGATIFGTLVHQTIEDIHKAALRNEVNKIIESNIKEWFDINYNAISKSERAYLGQGQLDAAFNQIIKYVNSQNGDWRKIQDAEVEVGLVKPNYILHGIVDLVKGESNTVEIIDFKAEKKPDLIKDFEKINHYKKQLEVYSHLIEEKTGKNVSRMHLYYTGAENEVPTITFEKREKSIDNTIEEFDKIVGKIQKKDFTKKAKYQVLCDNCDMRFYCKE